MTGMIRDRMRPRTFTRRTIVASLARRSLTQSLRWIAAQAPDQQAPVALIYAWNENDEGGWLMPTWPCQTDRLDALHQVLKKTAVPSHKPELC
jgi:hypothetical protein